VTVAGGVAAVTLVDTVVETFEVAITNNALLSNPANDSIAVSPGAPTQVVITGAGSDFTTDGSTNLTVQVQDANNNLVSTDNGTQITFSPTLSGTISAIVTGTGDGSYGVVGGAETVTVVGGVGTVTLVDTVVETFEVAITNSALLSNPANDSIIVSVGAPAQVAITGAGSDFTVDGSTNLTVEVQDAAGNLITTDNATQITFSPTLNGTISAVVTGSGDGSYGVVSGAETVTVAGGVATVTLVDTVVETFEVAITNSASLSNPANDSITVSAGAPAQVAITGAGSDFTTDGSTNLTVQVQDSGGNLVTTDNATQITFSPTLSGTISAAVTGTGDGSYGVVGGAETVTVVGGVATVTLVDTVVETFEVAITNSALLSNPANDSITVTPGAPTQVVMTGPGSDFATDGSTNLTVQVQDAGGNLVTTDNVTQITVSPTLSGTISAVVTGSGDGSYGVVGGAETVTVVSGVAAVTLD